jgi:DNA-binding PadR family transcriptional regulator
MRPLKDLRKDLRAVILEMAATPRGFLIGELSERCNITQAMAYRALARMRDDGFVAVTWIGHGGRWTEAERVGALRDQLQREVLERDRKRRAAWHKARKVKRESEQQHGYVRVSSVFEWRPT